MGGSSGFSFILPEEKELSHDVTFPEPIILLKKLFFSKQGELQCKEDKILQVNNNISK